MSTPPEIAALLSLVASMEQRLTAQDARIVGLDDRVRHLEREQRAAAASVSAPVPAPPANLDEARQREKAEMLSALQATGWNRLEAGKRMGIPRRTFYRRMLEYGIQEGDSRTGVVKREKARRKVRKKG